MAKENSLSLQKPCDIAFPRMVMHIHVLKATLFWAKIYFLLLFICVNDI